MTRSDVPEASGGQSGTGHLYFNGSIHTMDDSRPMASTLAVRDGSLLYVGNNPSEAASLLSPLTPKTDLRGRCVIPGLIDSHLHFLLQGRRLAELDIFQKPKEEILRLVAREAERLGPGAWILGRGWDHEKWPDNRWPNKEELDRAAPDNPVALSRIDAHSIWVNTLALTASGIDRHTPDPQGGEILRTPGGDLLGILSGTPIFKVWAVMPSPSREQALEAYIKAQKELFSFGITSLGDAWQTMADHQNLKLAYAEDGLKIRVSGMLASVDLQDRPYFRQGFSPVVGLFGERLFLRAFKVVLDGSLGSRSAWFRRDYADRPGHKGNGRYTDERLYSLIRPAAREGFQICLHAIGDAAVAQAVRTLRRIQAEYPVKGLRHRIEHFQTASPQNVQQTVDLGIIPAMQTIHAVADKKMAEIRLAPDVLGHSYPWRAVLDAGGILANGSDSPMEVVNPFWGMHAALSRTPFSGRERQDAGGLRMTRLEALRSYTVWAAAAELNEARKGSLAPGKLADFAVLDRDILTCPEAEVKDVRVLLTVLGGEPVYGNPSL